MRVGLCVCNPWSHRDSFEFVFSGGPPGLLRSGGVLAVVCVRGVSCGPVTNRNLRFVFCISPASNLAAMFGGASDGLQP